MRTLKFKLLTQSQLFTLESDARTFGELKDEIRSKGLYEEFGVSRDSNLSELNIIEYKSKTTYALDDSTLPAGDALFFVSLTKSKGGALSHDEVVDLLDLKEEIKECSYMDLRNYVKYLNATYGAAISVQMTRSRADLEGEAHYFIESMLPKQQTEVQAEMVNFDKLSPKEQLESVAEILLSIAENITDTTAEEIVDGITISELNDQAAKVHAELLAKGAV